MAYLNLAGEFEPCLVINKEDLKIKDLFGLKREHLVLLATEVEVDTEGTKKNIVDRISRLIGIKSDAEVLAIEKDKQLAEERAHARAVEEKERAAAEADRAHERAAAEAERAAAEADRAHARAVEERERAAAEADRAHARTMDRLHAEASIREKQQEARGSSENVPHTANLLPKFSEEDPETFFRSFEKVAVTLKWPEQLWTITLQKELVGRAQEVVSALTFEESQDYEIVKRVVLSAYKLVPEAYRQKFRELKRSVLCTYIEFGRQKENLFDRWCRAKEVGDFNGLRELVLLEDFKTCLPMQIRTHLDDRKPATLTEAAHMADEYELTHKRETTQRLDMFQKGNIKQCENCQRIGHLTEKCWFSAAKDERRDGKQDGGNGKESKCYFCGKPGHIKAHCLAFMKSQKDAQTICLVNDCKLQQGSTENLTRIKHLYKDFLSKGKVRCEGVERAVTILRDTGAAQSLVRREVLPDINSISGDTVLIQGVDGAYLPISLITVHLTSEIVSGSVSVGIIDDLPLEGVDIILGNDIAGGVVHPFPKVSSEPTTDPDLLMLEEKFPNIFPACVVTRAQAKMKVVGEDFVANEKAPEAPQESCEVDLSDTFLATIPINRTNLVKNQKQDLSLKQYYMAAISVEESEVRGKSFYVKNGVLMRKWRPSLRPADEDWNVVRQIVLPSCYRERALEMAHSSPFSGHLGVRKTQSRLLAQFYWPGLHKAVAEHCKSCHTCQISGKTSEKPAPLNPVPAFGEPFSRVLIDCVGPLPKTKSGNQFLLTIMDAATRFPEAIPLKNIKTPTIVDALTIFFTRYGMPKELQSDRGSNFMSHTFKQMMQQLGVHHFISSPYHPQSQGALERFHKTLKSILRGYCSENQKDWDKGVPFALFAVRDIQNESTGYSPFELVFGHDVRGPLKVMHENLLGGSQEHTNLVDYVSQFKERICSATQLARENLKNAQLSMKTGFDKKAKEKGFVVGEKVLALIPTMGHSLSARFGGPYRIAQKLGPVTYVVSTPDKTKKKRVCHVNMIKKYHDRAMPLGLVVPKLPAVQTEEELGKRTDSIPLRLKNSQIIENLNEGLGQIPENRRKDLTELIDTFPQLFSDKLGQTTLAKHDVEIGEAAPIKSPPYRVNPLKRAAIKKEVSGMLKDGIIKQSSSSWSSPVLLVPKPDGTYRFVIDYRKVNAVTRADAFPIPRIEDCIDEVGHAKVVTKVDLIKGFWQVPLTERAKDISAFVTPDGLYQCNYMPFGMKNSPATFQRLMARVLEGVPGCVVYLDDVVVYSGGWAEHMVQLRCLFSALAEAGLVVNLGKCSFGTSTIEYLGHVIGAGKVMPKAAKVSAINNFPLPTSKRDVMRFLGMAGFFRRFCRNYSAITTPMTNLLQKGKGFKWTEECQNSFERVKALMTNSPVLAVARFDKQFLLAVDACDTGVGAVLLQEDGQRVERPIGYFSKKLNKHQQNYSTIEKEALALVLGVQHFEIYLTNSPDEIQVYTDHNPLTFLDKFRTKNQRICRWGLLLQPYPLKITHISGKDNVVADALSRAHKDDDVDKDDRRYDGVDDDYNNHDGGDDDDGDSDTYDV